jgi:hypothetical protein
MNKQKKKKKKARSCPRFRAIPRTPSTRTKRSTAGYQRKAYLDALVTAPDGRHHLPLETCEGDGGRREQHLLELTDRGAASQSSGCWNGIHSTTGSREDYGTLPRHRRRALRSVAVGPRWLSALTHTRIRGKSEMEGFGRLALHAGNA